MANSPSLFFWSTGPAAFSWRGSACFGDRGPRARLLSSAMAKTLRDPRHRLGLAGELRVMRWLAHRGWWIEAHRFRVGRHDVDLVIRRGVVVAFVEVKTRRGRSHGAGREAIGWRKRRAIAWAAEAWRIRHGRAGDVYRFDVVEVEAGCGDGARAGQIRHYEDAWRILE